MVRAYKTIGLAARNPTANDFVDGQVAALE